MTMKCERTVNHPATQPGNKNVADLILELILLLFNVVSSKPFITFMATAILSKEFSLLFSCPPSKFSRIEENGYFAAVENCKIE